MTDWLSELGWDCESLVHTDEGRMARVIREQSAVLHKTNPWVAGFIPNGYRCMYCRAFVRFTCIPKGMEFMEQHKEDCIWRNLSPDAKELLK